EVASVDEKTAKNRKLVAQAALAELELAIKQGLAVAIADQTNAWSAMVSAARAKLLALGAKLGPIVDPLSNPAACKETRRAAIYEVLRELSGLDAGELVSEPSQGPGEPEIGDAELIEAVGTAAAADCKPVGRRKPAAKRRGKR